MYADVYNPFFKAVQAKYPPGSSFKPLSALIALQEGIITPQTSYYCPDITWPVTGNKCNNGEAHGLVNMSSAVAESCNGYFSMVFQKLIDHYGTKQTEATYTAWRDNVKKFGLAPGLILMCQAKAGVMSLPLILRQ